MSDDEVRRRIESASPVNSDELLPPEWSEDRLAACFTERHGDDLRFCAEWNRWLRWSGTHWKRDRTYEVYDLARAVCREAAAQIDNVKTAAAVASARTVAAIERLARSDRVHATEADWFDSHPFLLATPGGTVDLTTTEMRAARREDLITKCTAVAPDDGSAPVWEDFLESVTCGDAELRLYLQRLFGYGLTGDRREQIFAFFYGTGRNGKTVYFNTTRGIAGDYGRTVPADMFLASKGERHSTDMASLVGARLATASELNTKQAWDDARLKMLTGGERVAARFMRGDFFEFVPIALLTIAGNHRPALSVVNEAIRRRLHLVPFVAVIPEDKVDPELGLKLRAEWPQILAWGIEGAATWGGEGLRPPEAVWRATQDYLEAEDTLGEFLEEKCLLGPNNVVAISELFAAWRPWVHSRDMYVGSTKVFVSKLHDRGFARTRLTGGVKALRGLTLAPNPQPEE